LDSLTGKEEWENEADIEDSLIHQFEREAAMSARLNVEMAHTAWVRPWDKSTRFFHCFFPCSGQTHNECFAASLSQRMFSLF
jgi:hypothetical protein